MSRHDIQALTFDTGGTILDWHRGFKQAFHNIGSQHGIDRDWGALTNELRRRSMKAMLNLGENATPTYRFDDAHRFVLDELLAEYNLECFTEAQRHAIAYEAPHQFRCWPGFKEVQSRLRNHYIVASFSILSYRLIIDTAKANGLNWDAVFSCEGIGKYKLLPESYRAVADYLQLQPEQICMVACHPFDLDAARAVGFKTAYVKRAEEWGPETSLPAPVSRYDIVVDDFDQLADALGVDLESTGAIV